MKIAAKSLVVFFVVTISMLVLIYLLGFRINTSDSIPRGIYRINKSFPLKNNYVIFCPDNRFLFKQAIKRGYISHGLCPSGYGYLMKKVVAVEGDSVISDQRGVFVNGQLLPYSRPLKVDGHNRQMSQWKTKNYRLRSNEILTMTDRDTWSFDARYYGLIHTVQIRGRVKKLL